MFLLEYSRPSDRFLLSQADNIELARDIQNLALGFIEFCRKRIQNVFGFCLLQLKLRKFSFAFFRFDERELSVFFCFSEFVFQRTVKRQFDGVGMVNRATQGTRLAVG